MPSEQLQASTDAIQNGAKSYPLPGYSRRNGPHGDVVASTELLEEFAAVVEGHGTLYSWARQQPQPKALRGRAPVYVATLSGISDTTVVVRHSWHGGMFAPLTGDRYLRPTRAPIELLRSFMLRECNVPTPEVLAFALYRAGPLMARVDVATRFIPAAFDFGDVLRNVAPATSRAAAHDAIETLLVQLASFGFTHPDLNVKNVLLYQVAGVLIAAVLDVDVVQWSTSQAPADIMLANVARLARSIRKLRVQTGAGMSDTELSDFVERMLGAAPTTSRVAERKQAEFNSRHSL